VDHVICTNLGVEFISLASAFAISTSKPMFWLALLGSGKTYGAPPVASAPHWKVPGMSRPALATLSANFGALGEDDEVVVGVLPAPQAVSNSVNRMARLLRAFQSR
jgi:hypothetical protein